MRSLFRSPRPADREGLGEILQCAFTIANAIITRPIIITSIVLPVAVAVTVVIIV